ncbi:MAG TPA: SDR family oxidoreductase [Jatrophihabitantaceae bacterium]|jgi:3-oxoacyl-[acyl-carrier protein] reductase
MTAQLLDLNTDLALVTGGSRGVGRAIALQLAAAGADVAISYRRDKDSAVEVVEQIRRRGLRAHAVAADLSAPAAAVELYGSCADALGPPTLLVCNAGIASSGHSAADSTDAEYEKLWRVHFLSNIALARAALPSMRQSGTGRIVFISSAYAALRPAGTGPYVAAKSALEAAAEVMAKEERAHGIRINIVAPGLVATDMGDRLVQAGGRYSSAADLDAESPFGRVCRPDDVANVVLFALGSIASYVTAQRLVVDGGG